MSKLVNTKSKAIKLFKRHNKNLILSLTCKDVFIEIIKNKRLHLIKN